MRLPYRGGDVPLNGSSTYDKMYLPLERGLQPLATTHKNPNPINRCEDPGATSTQKAEYRPKTPYFTEEVAKANYAPP